MLITKKYRKQGVILATALLTGFIVGNVVLKNLIGRARPCWLNTDIRLLIATPMDYSFPSGHTLSSFAAATVLCRANRKFAYAAIPLALLIAVSRLYLYVHFPSDIIGAGLIGIFIGTAAVRCGDRFTSKEARAAEELRR